MSDESDGKARVRAMWGDLDAMGVKPPKGMTRERYAEMQRRMVDRLAYLDPENVETLRDLISEHATGPARDRCPSEQALRMLAEGLQARPRMQARIVTSWLASIEGPEALARGDLVEVYRRVRATGLPPTGPYTRRQIADESAENARQRSAIQSRIERGTASPADRAWIAAWRADEREALALVDAGKKRRAQQQAEGQET